MPKNSKSYTKVKKIANPTRVTIVNDDFDPEVEGGSNFDDPVNNNSSSLDDEWKNQAIGDDPFANERNRTGVRLNGQEIDPRTEKPIKKGMLGRNNAEKTGRERERGASGKDKDAAAKKAGGMDAVKGLEGAINGASAAMPIGKVAKVATGNFKKYGPMSGLVGLIMLVGLFIFGAQSLAPFGFAANALDQLNAPRTGSSMRTKYMRKFQMSGHRNTVAGGIFSEEHFKISKKMEKRMNKQGIEVDRSGKATELIFKDADGTITRVTPDNLESALKGNNAFYAAYEKSTRTLKGHIAGWFDSISAHFHNRIQNSRHRYADTQGDSENENIKGKIKEKGHSEGMEKSIADSDGNAGEEWEEQKMEIDPETGESKPVTKIDPDTGESIPVMERRTASYGKNDGLTPTKAMNRQQLGDALTARAKRAMARNAKGEKWTNIGCVIMKTIGNVSMTIGVLHTLNVLNYATQFLEAIDNVKAGNSTAALNYNMGLFSTPGNTYGVEGNADDGAKPVREGTSSLSSPAWNSFFGGPMIRSDDEVAKQFNVEYASTQMFNNIIPDDDITESLNKIASVVGKDGNKAIYQTCAVAAIAFSAADAALAAAELIGAFLSGGATLLISAAKEVFEGFAERALIAAGMAALTMALSALIPHVAQALLQDFLEDAVGEEAAYALASGANVYMGRNMQSGSGKPGTKAQVIAQWRETQDVIAEEARYERMTRSPFDMTNKNTFLGSIAYALMPIGFQFSNHSTGFGGAVSEALTTTGSAIATLTGTKTYADEVTIATGLNEDCPTLSAMGLVGDAYCNPYYVTDLSTITMDPGDVFLNICEGNFDEGCNLDGDTNPKIKKKSDFSKWVVACATRESQWGYVDERVNSFVTGNGTVDSVIGVGMGALSAVPIVGDVASILQDDDSLKQLKWNTGEMCVSDESKYYSRYSEDQRWMESEGLIEKSAVSAFLDDYYKENPLDNSFEGIIARYTGMSDDEVDYTLGMIEYLAFINNYDPDERVKLFEETPKKYYRYNGSERVAEDAVNIVRITYFDLRGRTYTV